MGKGSPSWINIATDVSDEASSHSPKLEINTLVHIGIRVFIVFVAADEYGYLSGNQSYGRLGTFDTDKHGEGKTQKTLFTLPTASYSMVY